MAQKSRVISQHEYYIDEDEVKELAEKTLREDLSEDLSEDDTEPGDSLWETLFPGYLEDARNAIRDRLYQQFLRSVGMDEQSFRAKYPDIHNPGALRESIETLRRGIRGKT